MILFKPVYRSDKIVYIWINTESICFLRFKGKSSGTYLIKI